MGAHAGMRQLAAALARDPSGVAVQTRQVSDGDEDFRWRHPALRERARRLVQRGGVAGYKLSDLDAELRELPASLLGGTDVVHFLDGEHGAQFLPAALRRARRLPLARLRRARTVATFHQPPEMLDDLLDRAVVADLDAVTLVAPTQAAWFRELLPDDRVEVLLHGVDVDFFRPAAPAPARAAHPPAPLRCVTVGHWLRDWTAVRQVAERLPDVAFDVVTSRPTGCEALANVRHHRDVSDEGLRALYQQADVLFLPLTASTANNALLEGLACGLPVVTTDLAAVRAYAGDDTGALVRDNDPDALAAALVARREDPARRIAEGARSRARAEALSWPASAAAHARLYRRLLATAP
jgi:glycosyltransferase involved in cell wall biosynthesis